MNNRNDELVAPHTHPEHFMIRYLEELMRLTYEHPVLIKDLIYAAGVSSLLLVSSYWSLPAFGIDAPLAAATATVAGVAGTLFSLANGFAQQKVFGFPLQDDEHGYQSAQFSYKSATAAVTIDDKAMPLLTIKADDHYDAGYAEGYILGVAIKNNLEHTNFLYALMRIGLGAPKNNADLNASLAKILATIPQAYQDEMHGKVDGYNAWLETHDPAADKLTFERYLLLQIMPDLRNYNPFSRSSIFSGLLSALSSFWMPRVGCTTIALRLGEYTFFSRILDWPAHNMAGKYFLQVDRKIGADPRIIDIGLPLLSGALTVLNEDGLLVEMNVAKGDKVTEPAGMPAVFFNRYVAEHAHSVQDIEVLLAETQPLGAYHLTATDGQDTRSFHFYQSAEVRGEHVIEALGADTKSPQLLVVANNGMKHEGSKPKPVNHRDSNQRKDNINYLFNHCSMQERFFQCISKQENDGELSQQDITDIKEILLQMGGLPLVKNCESVLDQIAVYHRKELIDACAATDNLFVQNKPLAVFKQLCYPARHGN